MQQEKYAMIKFEDIHFLCKETFMHKMCIMLHSGYRTTKICLTDHMPLIRRVINKLLESHSMPLLNHYFITFNELMFFWQSERFVACA